MQITSGEWRSPTITKWVKQSIFEIQTICLMSYNHKYYVLSAVLKKTFPFFFEIQKYNI